MAKSTVFISNRSQAVRLPKAVAFPGRRAPQVEIIKLGQSRLITPVGRRWDEYFGGPRASEDFMVERNQGAADEREPF